MQAMSAERTSVLWEGVTTEERNKCKGIKQGCPLSPYIFTLIIQKVLHEVKNQIPYVNLLEFNNGKLPVILAFADDLLIIARTTEEIERIMKALKRELIKVGLEINASKSQILIREPHSDRNIPEKIKIDGEEYNVVRNMRYLGTFFTDTLDRPETNRKRCKQAIGSSKIIIEFLRRYKPSWSLAKLIYKTVISPAITYGMKAAALVKRNRISISRYEMQILKEMIKYCRDRPRGKVKLSRLLDGKTAVKKIRVMRINYWGHIERRPTGLPLKVARKMRYEKKKLGRPAKTWNDSVEEDKQIIQGVTEEDWKELAKDKEKLKAKAEEIYKYEGSEEETESEVEG